MNKKIKIIDLLNKIANGEEIPKKIKYCNLIWEEHNKRYFREGTDMIEDYLANAIIESLNDEVEILEDNTDIFVEIENDLIEIKKNLIEFEETINKLEKVVNEIDKRLEEK